MRQALFLLLWACLAVGASSAAHAEILQNVYPYNTLGDIRARYPQAEFKRVAAAWVTEDQAFYSMQGAGFVGTLYLAFSDQRPQWKRRATATVGVDFNALSLEDQVARNNAWKPDDEALVIAWVRWIPPKPIPLSRLKARYGNPSKCDFDNSDFTPLCHWPARALVVQTTDDHQMATLLETGFTEDERRAELRKMFPAPAPAGKPEKR